MAPNAPKNNRVSWYWVVLIGLYTTNKADIKYADPINFTLFHFNNIPNPTKNLRIEHPKTTAGIVSIPTF